MKMVFCNDRDNLHSYSLEKKHDNKRTYDILKKSHVQTVNLEDDNLKFSYFETLIRMKY